VLLTFNELLGNEYGYNQFMTSYTYLWLHTREHTRMFCIYENYKNKFIVNITMVTTKYSYYGYQCSMQLITSSVILASQQHLHSQVSKRQIKGSCLNSIPADNIISYQG